MRRTMLAAATLLVGTTLGQAADLAVKAPRFAPPPVPFSWNGLYIGGHFGGAWGTTESNLNSIAISLGGQSEVIPLTIPISQTSTNGWLGGVQAGYNLQIAPWVVIGIEGQFSWTDLKGASPCLVVVTCATKHDWIGTVAARFGVTAERLMIYGKVGVAWTKVNYGATLALPEIISVTTDVGDTRQGWMLGAGVEYAFLGNLSAKLEYNYLDFGDRDYNFLASVERLNFDFNTTVHERVHLIKAGLNYRFDLGKAPAPAFLR